MRRWIVVAIVTVLVAVVLVTVLRRRAYRPEEFTFAVLGDAPYELDDPSEVPRFLKVLQQLDAENLAFVIHVGDISWKPCTDATYQETLARFNGVDHPLIYTPGDNEWTDCWDPQIGAMAPLERLAALRKIFFSDPSHSLGKKKIDLATQGAIRGGLPENARWQHRKIVFATVHIVGSKNAMAPFPGRTAADDAESKQRTAAAASWVRATFAHAKKIDARAVVIAFHANPAFEGKPGSLYREAFEPFLLALEEETEAFGKPVLVVHGDFHNYQVDQPLVRRTTQKKLENFTRMQVPGSPQVGWVRVTAKPAAKAPFAFDVTIVPK